MRLNLGRSVRAGLRRIAGGSGGRRSSRMDFSAIDPTVLVGCMAAVAGGALLFALSGLWQVGAIAGIATVAAVGHSLGGIRRERVIDLAEERARRGSKPAPKPTAAAGGGAAIASLRRRRPSLEATLDRHSVAAIVRALARLSPKDAERRRLFEAYLDRRQPGWREDLQRDRDAGRAEAARAAAEAAAEQEAYEVLGLRPGASHGEIRAAHRSLIRRAHPDAGGSAALAAKINEAKQRLLSGERKG